MPKIIVLTNKGALTAQQVLYIGALHEKYGVDCIIQLGRKNSSKSRYQRYWRELKKHGISKGFLVLANIPFVSPLFENIATKRSLLLEAIIDRHVIDTISVIDGGILNSDESVAILKEMKPDILFQCGAGIIKPKTFQVARLGMINLHHGIIPSIRGMVSVQWAIREQRPDWIGISLHMIDEGLDTGALIGQARCSIEATDDAASIYYKLDLLGARLLTDGIAFLSSDANPKPAPKMISSVYRSSFTIFDTLIYKMREKTFFKRLAGRSEEYVIGEYLRQS
jgi:folate-dependent phosphoribosylglycinamide formyltransferase PurN